jgi:hypothetical protein
MFSIFGATRLHVAFMLHKAFVVSKPGFLGFAVFLLFAVGGESRASAIAATNTDLSITFQGNSITTVDWGSTVTLTATVTSSGTAVTTGQVRFCEVAVTKCTDLQVIGTAQLTGAGSAAMKFIPGIGNHIYRAFFVATNSVAASSSQMASLAVTGKYPTVSTISQSGSPGNYSLVATVDGYGNGPGMTAPTGTVSFMDLTNGNYVLGTAPLGSGIAGFRFNAIQTPATGQVPTTVRAADFNGDGIVDLVTENQGDRSLTLLLGKGDGTFTASTIPGINLVLYTVNTADFNGDGKADLVVFAQDNTSPTVFLGNGDGTFTAVANPTGPNGPPGPTTIGDFNNDGLPDIVVANYNLGTVTLFLGNGDGTFRTPIQIAVGSGPGDLTTADFNGDGNLDLAVANSQSYNVSVLLGRGDGTFTMAATSPFVNNVAISVASGDFNGDGKPDLTVGTYGEALVWLGNGDGSFTVASNAPLPPGTSSQVFVAVADFNRDGIADIAEGNYGTGKAAIILGKGDGTFTLSTAIAQLPPTIGGFLSAVTDLNGDGVPDIAIQNASYTGAVTVLLTGITRTVTASVNNISPVGAGIHQIAASYGGDGGYSTSTSASIGLTAQPLPTTLSLTANPTSSTYGQQVLLTATLNPYTAQGHSTDGETVTFLSGAQSVGTGTLSGSVASINVTSLQAGTNTLKATFTGDIDFLASSSVSLPFIVEKASPTITFVVPSHSYGDQPFAISASSNSGGAIVYTVVSGPANVSGSTVTITGTGNVILQATQAAFGNFLAGNQQASFTVTAGSQTITFAQPVTPVNFGIGSLSLTASSSSGLPVTFRIVSGPAAVGGSTLTITGAGTVVVAANQAGDSNYLAAPEVARSIQVNKIAPAIVLTSTPSPTFAQNKVVVTAKVTSPLSVPTGMVTFFDGGISLGTVMCNVGVATLNIDTLAVGSHSISALYNGDSNFSSVTSTVNTQLIQDFGLTGSSTNTSQTVQAGGTANFTFSVSPLGGASLPADVSFSVAGLPSGAIASFAPQTIPTGSGASSVTLTVQVAARTTLLRRIRDEESGSIETALGILLLPFVRRTKRSALSIKRILSIVLMVIATASLVSLTACGSDKNQSAETYSLTVTGSSGSLSHTVTAMLTVK